MDCFHDDLGKLKTVHFILDMLSSSKTQTQKQLRGTLFAPLLKHTQSTQVELRRLLLRLTLKF
jgi:hypothetical protein